MEKTIKNQITLISSASISLTSFLRPKALTLISVTP